MTRALKRLALHLAAARTPLAALLVLLAVLTPGGPARAQGGYIPPQTGYEQNPYVTNPYGQNPYATSPYGQNPYGQAQPYEQAQPPYGQAQPYGQTGGDDDVSMFYHALAPYGDWFYTPAYGYVWYPYVDHARWRPYVNDGYWVYSEYGWTWISTVEWGWAPFHYGRWVYLDSRYWVWVPDTVWGPAWVAWRYGDEHVGWAPLPPGAYWYPQTGLEVSVNLPLGWWIFVAGAYLLDTNVQSYVVPYQRTNRIYYASRPATTYTVQAGVPVCVGVDIMWVRRWVGAPIRQVSLTITTQPGYYRGGSRGSVSLYRPSSRPDRRVDMTPPPPRMSAPASLQYMSAPPPPRSGAASSQYYGRQSSGTSGSPSSNPYRGQPAPTQRDSAPPPAGYTSPDSRSTAPTPTVAPLPRGSSEVRQEQAEVREQQQEVRREQRALREEVKELRHDQRTGPSSDEVKAQRQEVRDQAREVRREAEKVKEEKKDVRETRKESRPSRTK